MSEVKQDRLVRESFVIRILENLYNWSPVRRQSNGGVVQVNTDGQTTNLTTNENEIALGNYNETDINTLLSIGIGSEQQRKNAISINKDGEIFIITDLKTSSVESLQKRIENNTLTICKTIDELLFYKNEQYISKLLYLTDTINYNEITYYAGLYSVSKDNSNNVILSNLGISANVDLTNYYTKDEVDLIIDKVNAGETDLLNYYTKTEIDKTVDSIITANDKNISEIKAVIGKEADDENSATGLIADIRDLENNIIKIVKIGDDILPVTDNTVTIPVETNITTESNVKDIVTVGAVKEQVEAINVSIENIKTNGTNIIALPIDELPVVNDAKDNIIYITTDENNKHTEVVKINDEYHQIGSDVFVTWNDTVSVVTTTDDDNNTILDVAASKNGLMTAADKFKLDSIDAISAEILNAILK